MSRVLAVVAAGGVLLGMHPVPQPRWKAVREDGWPIPDLEYVQTPSRAYTFREKVAGGLDVLERHYWGSRRRVVLPSAACEELVPDEDLSEQELVVAYMRGYFRSDRAYAVRLVLRKPVNPEEPICGCECYTILLDEDGDGLFETLLPDVDPLVVPAVPGWLAEEQGQDEGL